MTRLRVALGLAVVVLAAGCGGNTIAAGDWSPTWVDDCPVWSADGGRLAFGRHPVLGNGQPAVYVWNGSSLRRVFAGDARVLGWRGRSLVLHDETLVTLLDVASGRERVLFDVGYVMGDPTSEFSVAPGSGRIAVIGRSRDEAEPTLFVVDRHERLLLRRKGVVVARWSSRGALAYSDLDRLVVLRGNSRPLVRRPGGSALAWSSDGRLLAFDRAEPGLASDVWVLDVRTGRERRLTHAGDEANVPSAWAQDGRMILIRTSASGGLAEVDRRGGVARRLPAWGGAWPGTGVECPAASRDGRVAFLRTWDDADVRTSSVYVSPAGLTGATPLR